MRHRKTKRRFAAYSPRPALSTLRGRRRLILENLEQRQLLAVDLELLRDFRLGAGSSSPQLLGTTSQHAIIAVHDGVTRQLWSTDGSAGEPVMIGTGVKAWAPHTSQPDRGRTAAVGNRLFFNAQGNSQLLGDDEQAGLWVSDGTADGTLRIGDPFVWYDAEEITATDERVFFVGAGAAGGAARRLWAVDATTLEYHSILTLDPGDSSSFRRVTDLTAGQAQLYFVGVDETHGRELWTSNGTSDGTFRLSDFAPGIAYSDPQHITPLGQQVLFSALDGSGSRYWAVSNGTSAGTSLLNLSSHTAAVGFEPIVSLGSQVVLIGRLNDSDPWSLYSSDGSASGTQLVTGLTDPVDGLMTMGNKALVRTTGYDPGLGQTVTRFFATDGLTIEPLPALDSHSLIQLVTVNDRGYFLLSTNAGDSELWTTDGTSLGTTRLIQAQAGRQWASMTATRALDMVVLRLVTEEGYPGSFDIYRHNLAQSELQWVGSLQMHFDADPGMHAVGSHVLLVGGNEATGDEVWRVNIEAPPAPLPFVVNTMQDIVDPNDNVTSLREAIALANARSGVDTILFDSVLNGIPLVLSQGQLSITDDLVIKGNGRVATVIDGNNSSRLFDVSASVTNLTFDGLQLRQGSVTDQHGGAIRAESTGTLSITDSLLELNRTLGDSALGGAIYATSSDIRIINSTLDWNYTLGADARAGAIYIDNGDIEVFNSTITNNSTTSIGASGGAFFLNNGYVNVIDSAFGYNFTSSHDAPGGVMAVNQGDVSIVNSSFLFNFTSSSDSPGGAIYAANGSVNVVRSSFDENFTSSSRSAGGAIYVGDGTLLVKQSQFQLNGTSNSDGGALFAFNAPLTVESSTFSQNYASDAIGGAVASESGSIAITNSTLSRNQSKRGGAVYSGSADILLNHTTVFDNQVLDEGGGIYAGDTSSLLVVRNSIVAGNLDSGVNPDLYAGGNLVVESSIIGDQQGTTLSEDQTGASGNFIGSSSSGRVIDPALAPLRNYGGIVLADANTTNGAPPWMLDYLRDNYQHLAGGGVPVLTHALLPVSPAIDLAHPATTVLTDQRGVARQGGPEAGAFELESYFSPGGKSFATEIITGDLDLLTHSVVKIQITGDVTSEDYDRLIVTGLVTLNGTLHLDFTGSQPEFGASWDVMQWNSRSGQFSNVHITGIDPATTLGATVQYLESGLRIIIEPVGATIRWDGGASTNNWHDAANWTNDRLPNSNDIVWLDSGIASITLGGDVTVSQLFSARHLLLSGSQRLTVTSGGDVERLTIQTSATLVTSGVFTVRSSLSMAGGSISTAGELRIHGAMSWTAGTLGGSGSTLINGALTLSGTNNKSLQTHSLIVNGVATLSGTGSLFGTNSTLRIASGGLFDIRSDVGLLYGSGSTSSLNLNIDQGGTLRKSAGSGTTSIQFNLNNHGLVDVQSGTLQLTRDGTSSGTFLVGSEAVLTFTGGTQVLPLGGQIVSQGLVWINGGVVSLTEAHTFPRVRVSAGTLSHTGAVTVSQLAELSGGTWNSAGQRTIQQALTWTAGTLGGSGQTLFNGTLSLSGTSSKSLQTHSLIVSGVATVSGTGSLFGTNSTLRIASGGLFDIRSDVGLLYGSGSTSSLNLNIDHGGTLRKSAGSGTTSIQFNLNNDGVVDVQSGTLQLTRDGTSSGTFLVGSETVLTFTGGTQVLPLGGQIVSQGLVWINGAAVSMTEEHTFPRIRISSGTLSHAGAVTVSQLAELSGGTWNSAGLRTIQQAMSWPAGTLGGSGSTLVNGALTLSGTNNKSLQAHSLIVSGVATVSGTGSLFGTNSTLRIASGGLFDIRSDVGLLYGSGSTSSLNLNIDHGGTLRKSAGSGTTSIQFNLNNHGLVDIQTGIVTVTGGFSQDEGTMRLSGGLLHSNSTLTFASGILAGVGTVDARVAIQAATVSPGAKGIGSLNFSSDLTISTLGSVQLQIGGTSNLDDYARIVVSGLVSLNGTLRGSLAADFIPANQAEFTIVSAANRSGAFAQTDFSTLPENVELRVEYSTTGAKLVAIVAALSVDASLFSQQLRDGVTATFDALPNWATRFNMSAVSLDIPLLPGEFADTLSLPNLLGPMLARPAVQLANDWALFRSQLEAAGFSILSFPGEDSDTLRVKYMRTIAKLSGNEALKQESLGSLANLASTVKLNGSFEHAADLQLEFIFGVDADGFFMQGDSGLTLTSVASGNVSGNYELPLVDLDIAAAGSLGGLLSVEVTPADTNQLFRITDVGTPPATWLSTDVDGTVRLNLAQTVQPLDLSFAGTWVATLTNSGHTGTSSTMQWPDPEQFLEKAVPWLGQQANTILSREVAKLMDTTSLPLVNGRLPESTDDWHKLGFVAALAPLGLGGYVAVAGTGGIAAWLADRGIVIEESLDQLRIQNLLAGHEINVDSLLKLRLATDPTKFSPIPVSWQPNYTGAGALSGLDLQGSFQASMLPDLDLGLAIDHNGFYLAANSRLQSNLTLSGATTATAAPFFVTASLGGLVSPMLAIVATDANQDGKVRLQEMTDNLGRITLDVGAFDGALGIDLTLGFLNYIDADGNPSNNSDNGGDPFRFAADLTFIVTGGENGPRFVPNGLEIKNPDVNADGIDDFTTRVLLQNMVAYGRDRLSDLFNGEQITERLSQLGNLVTTTTPIRDLFQWNDVFSTLDPANVAQIATIGPGTVVGSNLIIKEIVTFDQLELWLNTNWPTDVTEFLQLELSGFEAAVGHVTFDLSGVLPQDMRDQGWNISASLIDPAVSGSLLFGIDNSASPFYLGTSTNDVQGQQIPHSALSAAASIEVSLSNTSLFEGRLTLDKVTGRVRPNFTLDFTGVGGADRRLRLSELNELSHAQVTLLENTLESIFLRADGSFAIPGLETSADQTASIDVYGSFEGLGDKWHLTSQLQQNQQLKLGGFKVKGVSVSVDSEKPAVGPRSFTGRVRGVFEVPFGSESNPIEIGFEGVLSDAALKLSGSMHLSDRFVGTESAPLLWLDEVTLTVDMLIPLSSVATVQGGVAIQVGRADVFPKPAFKQVKPDEADSPSIPQIDPEKLEKDRDDAAKNVSHQLGISKAQARERYAQLILAASDLIELRKFFGKDNREVARELNIALNDLRTLKESSSPADLDRYVNDRNGPVALAIDKLSLPMIVRGFHLPEVSLQTETDMGASHVLRLNSLEALLNGQADTIFYDSQTYLDIKNLGLERGLDRAEKRIWVLAFELPQEVIENRSVTAKDIRTLFDTESFFRTIGSEGTRFTEAVTYASFANLGREVALERFHKQLQVEFWEAPVAIINDALIKSSDVNTLLSIAVDGEMPNDRTLLQDWAIYERIKADGREPTFESLRKSITVQNFSDKLATEASRRLALESAVSSQQLLALLMRDDYPRAKLDDAQLYARIADPNIGLEGAIAWANGRILGSGLADRLKFEPVAAGMRVNGLAGSLHSSGRLKLEVESASLFIGELLKIDARGDHATNTPALTIQWDPQQNNPATPFVELAGITASIPLIEQLPSVSLTSVVFSRERLELGELIFEKPLLDLGYFRAINSKLTLPAQELQFDQGLKFPRLNGLAFESDRAIILPELGENGLVRVDDFNIEYADGQLKASVPQFNLEFGPFSTEITGARFNIGIGPESSLLGLLADEPLVSVNTASLSLKTQPDSELRLTATHLQILAGLDSNLLPRVRFSSIAFGSEGGIADALGLGDFLPLDLTELRIENDAELSDNNELRVQATGRFNIDLLKGKVPFEPFIEFRRSDDDLMPLLLAGHDGDGRIDRNDDPDNYFEVSIIVGQRGVRIDELPGRITLGIKNFELGAFVFEGAAFLGDFTGGVVPQEFGGYLKVDRSPKENPDRPVLENATELSSEELLDLNDKRPDYSLAFEDLQLSIIGKFTPAASLASDAIDRFAVFSITAEVDVGIRIKAGPVEMYGLSGQVKMVLTDDRADDRFFPDVAVSFDSVGVDYFKFAIGDYFEFHAKETEFFFTDQSKPIVKVAGMSMGSAALGLKGSVADLELDRRFIPRLDRAGAVQVTAGGEDSLIGKVLGFFPIVVDGFGFVTQPGFYARSRNNPEVITGIADPTQIRVRISGGMQSPEAWPERIRWPFTARVTDLEIDIPKAIGRENGFPITNLTEIEVGMEKQEFGPFKIGGRLKFGIVREPVQPGQAVGDPVYARLDAATGKIKRIEVSNPDQIPSGAVPLVYLQLSGAFNGLKISGEADLVISPLGPTLARLMIPTKVPLGKSGLFLTEVGGGISFGASELRSVEHPRELLEDPVFLDPFDISSESIRESILRALERETVTLALPITLGLSGVVSTVVPGIISGEANFVIGISTDEMELDLDKPAFEVQTGTRILGTGLLSVLGMPVGRAGILIDQSNLFSPEMSLAFAVPSPDSPLAFLTMVRAELFAKLEVGGANLVSLVGMREFIENLVSQTGDTIFERLAESLNSDRDKPLAELLAGYNPGPDFVFTASGLKSQLLTGPDALLPTLATFGAMMSSINNSPNSERSQALGELLPLLIGELPSFFFDVATLRQAARGDLSAQQTLAAEMTSRFGELTEILITSLLRAGSAAAESFNPSLTIEGGIQPTLFGFPVGSSIGGKIRLDKTGLRVEAEGGVLSAIKTFLPTIRPFLELSPLGPLNDQVKLDARIDFPDPQEFMELLLRMVEGRRPVDDMRLVAFSQLPVDLPLDLYAQAIVVMDRLPDDYDPVNHPERYQYTIVTDTSQIPVNILQFRGVAEFVEAMRIAQTAPYSLDLIDYFVDTVNPLANQWQVILEGSLSGYGMDNLVQFAGITFGPQFDNGIYQFQEVVAERLRLVVYDVLPEDLPESLLPLVILVTPDFPSDYDPVNHPDRYLYEIVPHDSAIASDKVKVYRADRFAHALRFGGILLSGDLRLPRVLSDPLGVYESIDQDRWPDGRSGWLPPVLPVVNSQRIEEHLLDVLTDFGRFGMESISYVQRLREGLTRTEIISRIEGYIPSPAGFLDLDNYRFPSLDADSSLFDAFAKAFDQSAAAELFGSAYLTGWGELNLIGINWGNARFDADLQGMNLQASLPLLLGLELDVLGTTRETSFLSMLEEFASSPLVQGLAEGIGGLSAFGSELVRGTVDAFGLSSISALLEAQRSHQSLLDLISPSIRSRLNAVQLEDALAHLQRLADFLGTRISIPVGRGELELSSQNLSDFAIEVHDGQTTRYASTVAEVGQQVLRRMFGQDFFVPSFPLEALIPSDLAALRVAAYTPMFAQSVENQVTGVEQNGGFRFELEMNYPRLFEKSKVTFELHASESLSAFTFVSLLPVPNFMAVVESRKLTLPNLLPTGVVGANEFFSLDDFEIRLEKNADGVFAILDGSLKILDRQGVRAHGRLALGPGGGVTGLLEIELNPEETLSLGSIAMKGKFQLHVNTTSSSVEYRLNDQVIVLRPGVGLDGSGSMSVNGANIASGRFFMRTEGTSRLKIEAAGQVALLGRNYSASGEFTAQRPTLTRPLAATSGHLQLEISDSSLPLRGDWRLHSAVARLDFSIGTNSTPLATFAISGQFEFSALNQMLQVSGSVSTSGAISLTVSDPEALTFGVAAYQFVLDIPSFSIGADPAATTLNVTVAGASATIPGLGTLTIPPINFQTNGSFAVTLASDQDAVFGKLKVRGRLVLRSLGSGSGLELAVLNSIAGTTVTVPRIVVDSTIMGQPSLLDVTMNEFAIRSSGSLSAVTGGSATGTLVRLGMVNALEITDAAVQFKMHVLQGFYVALSGAKLRVFGATAQSIGDVSFHSSGQGYVGTTLSSSTSTLLQLTGFALTKVFEKLGELPGMAMERLEAIQLAIGANLRLGDNGLEFAQQSGTNRSISLFGVSVTLSNLLVASNGVVQFDIVGPLNALGIFSIENHQRMEFRRTASGSPTLTFHRNGTQPILITLNVPGTSIRLIEVRFQSNLRWSSSGSFTNTLGGSVSGSIHAFGTDWLGMTGNVRIYQHSSAGMLLEISSARLRFGLQNSISVPDIRFSLGGNAAFELPNSFSLAGNFKRPAGSASLPVNLAIQQGRLVLTRNAAFDIEVLPGANLAFSKLSADSGGGFSAEVTGSLKVLDKTIASGDFKASRNSTTGILRLELTSQRQLDFGFMSVKVGGWLESNGNYNFKGSKSVNFSTAGSGFNGVISMTAASSGGIKGSFSGTATIAYVNIASASGSINSKGCLSISSGQLSQSFALADNACSSSLAIRAKNINGYVSGGLIFLDANRNGLLDFLDLNANGIQDPDEPFEPSAFTLADGSANLVIDPLFDQDGDGVIVAAEGRLVTVGGIDLSTGTENVMPLIGAFAPDGTVSIVSPVGTLVDRLMERHQLSSTAAWQVVSNAFGLTGYAPASFDPVAMRSEALELASLVSRSQARLHIAVVQMGRFFAAMSTSTLETAVSHVVDTLSDRIISGFNAGDLLSLDGLTTVIKDVSTSLVGACPDQSLISAAVQVMSQLQQRVDQLPVTSEYLTHLKAIQQVALTRVTDNLVLLASAEVTPAEFLARNSEQRLDDWIYQARIAEHSPVTISIDDPRATTDQQGTGEVEFVVRLSSPSLHQVTVDYLVDQSEQDSQLVDTEALQGQLVFEPGQVVAALAIPVKEIPLLASRKLIVRLFNPQFALLGKTYGTAAIARPQPELMSLSGQVIAPGRAGAMVGRISIAASHPESYAYSVSDPRFELVGDQLRLAPEQILYTELEPVVFVDITAISQAQSAEVTQTFRLEVRDALIQFQEWRINEGQQQRSHLRNIDLLFGSDDNLASLVEPGRLRLFRMNLAGEDSTEMALPELMLSGPRLRLNFGEQGLGGARNSNSADGYYRLEIDLDGDGHFDITRHVYRLLGDVNGDRRVDATDRAIVAAAMRMQDLTADVNGDGVINSIDSTLVVRAHGRKLGNDLLLD